MFSQQEFIYCTENLIVNYKDDFKIWKNALDVRLNNKSRMQNGQNTKITDM